MFTGIIEEIGYIKEFSVTNDGARIVVSCSKVLENIKYGDSIAINGCCQTVTDFDTHSFTAQVSRETLAITTFKNLKSQDIVNLERALTLQSRLGGHIVQGHIDCTAKFIQITKSGEFYELYFEVPENELRYIVHKGSIAINGISLTVATVKNNIVKIAIIPHTYKNTNLSTLQIGQLVNIETDILGRYIEKFLRPNNNVSKLTENFLQENGFL